jgi:aryl-alcohol dehydrogenase-like predicted oxidoreductase
METRKIADLEVSIVGLGCNNFGMRCDEEQSAAVVHAALDSGINFFDTADVYSYGVSESFLGNALSSNRRDVFIATKFGNPMQERDNDGGWKPIEGTGGASKGWITTAVEDSLRRLQTDRIDLYQLHIPAGDVPIDETIEALDSLVKDGKIRAFGCSNFPANLIDEATEIANDKGSARFASSQDHWSLLSRAVEESVIPAVERNGLKEIPYFPLASGMLTGKYTQGEEPAEDTRLSKVPENRRSTWMSDENFEVVSKLQAYAEERGHTLLELAISWLASHEVVGSVIAGATKPEQVGSNAQAASWKMTSQEIAEIGEIAS